MFHPPLTTNGANNYVNYTWQNVPYVDLQIILQFKNQRFWLFWAYQHHSCPRKTNFDENIDKLICKLAYVDFFIV